MTKNHNSYKNKKSRAYWLTTPTGIAERLLDFSAVLSCEGEHTEMAYQLKIMAEELSKDD